MRDHIGDQPLMNRSARVRSRNDARKRLSETCVELARRSMPYAARTRQEGDTPHLAARRHSQTPRLGVSRGEAPGATVVRASLALDG